MEVWGHTRLRAWPCLRVGRGSAGWTRPITTHTSILTRTRCRWVWQSWCRPWRTTCC